MNYLETKPNPGKVKTKDVTIAYESFGQNDDPTIILIQGTGATLVYWPIEFCQKLAGQGYRVVQFDNRDIGLSTKLAGLGKPDWAAILPYVKTCEPAPLPYALKDMAEDVIGLMDGLHIDHAHIVGVSMGGAIAQLVAIYFSERTLTLTSISASSGNPELPPGDEKALQAMGTPTPQTADPEILSNHLVKIYRALGSTDNDETLKERALAHINRSWYPEGTERQVAAVFIGDNCDRRKDLAKIVVPTLVIHGDADPLVKLGSGQEVADTIPNAEMVVVKGLGHDLSMEFVDILVDSILHHVEKIY